MVEKGGKRNKQTCHPCPCINIAHPCQCILVPADSWPEAPRDHIIIGMKALPAGDFPLRHVHAHAAHCYRNQAGWEQMLMRFHRGGGLLLDLEFITDDSGERFVTFGREAGSVGAALAIKTWTHQLQHPNGPELGPMRSYASRDELLAEAKRDLADGVRIAGHLPRIMIMGHRGYCGVGADDFIRDLGVPEHLVSKWGRAETEGKDYGEILEHDILVNCVSLFGPVRPFVSTESLEAPGRKLVVISDISNDSHSPNNPLPIYQNATNSDVEPTVRIPTPAGTPPLTIAMIPYLPSLLPREASEAAANGLYPALALLSHWDQFRVWKEVEKMYRDKIATLTQTSVIRSRL
jgi:saccharopine dehydrogenase (NAD+, L-lysine forming)